MINFSQKLIGNGPVRSIIGVARRLRSNSVNSKHGRHIPAILVIEVDSVRVTVSVCIVEFL